MGSPQWNYGLAPPKKGPADSFSEWIVKANHRVSNEMCWHVVQVANTSALLQLQNAADIELLYTRVRRWVAHASSIVEVTAVYPDEYQE